MHAQAGDTKIALIKDGPIFYMVLNTPFNMIDFNFIERCNQVMDEIEASQGEAVLVTIGSGKCFCSGFDLKMWEEKVKNKALSIVKA